MKPKHRNRRLALIALFGVLAVFGAFLLLKALGDSKELFKNPRDLVTGTFVQPRQNIRVGGLVVPDSIQKGSGLITEFQVIDFKNANPDLPALPVRYDGVLPDLFGEGQGVVISGKLDENGVFIASKVLAKHDENYMPKMPD
ncbi:MAG TPA: cytochrome c maturation protein CcmE [Gammaproteobacteria bacterium]|nr:cytochrome c maturation protein CcmE [Gammaproteobacteria bacterium]